MILTNKMYKYLISLALVLGFFQTQAQDPQFSQFYSMPLHLNPGFTGSTPMHRFNMAYRMQWPNMPKAFNTMALSYDYNLVGLNSGFGLMFIHDNAGSANLESTNISGSYAYKINFGNGWVATPGLQFGHVVRSLDYGKLLLNDQIGFGNSGIAPGTVDPQVLNMDKAGYFDFSTGLLLYNKRSWFGASVYHLNRPNFSLLEGNEKLPAKYSVHGGLRIPLYNGPMNRAKVSSVAPSFIYKKQGGFQQVDMGLHFYYEPIMVGAWYRGTIGKEAYNYGKQHTAILLMGLNMPQFEVGYSYDLALSQVGPASGGAHEITLTYLFKTKDSNKMKRRDKFIPCPAFLLN